VVVCQPIHSIGCPLSASKRALTGSPKSINTRPSRSSLVTARIWSAISNCILLVVADPGNNQAIARFEIDAALTAYTAGSTSCRGRPSFSRDCSARVMIPRHSLSHFSSGSANSWNPAAAKHASALTGEGQTARTSAHRSIGGTNAFADIVPQWSCRIRSLIQQPADLAAEAGYATRSRSWNAQNKKYRCASASVCAGGQVRCSPSAVTLYVSGSTVIWGAASLRRMSFLPRVRHPRTGSMRLVRP